MHSIVNCRESGPISLRDTDGALVAISATMPNNTES